MENSMAISQIIKSKIIIWSSNLTSGYIQKNWKQELKRYCIAMFMASHNYSQ